MPLTDYIYIQIFYRYRVNNRTLYNEDYRKLFVKTIKTEFDRLTNSSGNFAFSSPTNGKLSEQENYVSTNPSSEEFGDGE